MIYDYTREVFKVLLAVSNLLNMNLAGITVWYFIAMRINHVHESFKYMYKYLSRRLKTNWSLRDPVSLAGTLDLGMGSRIKMTSDKVDTSISEISPHL